MQQMQKWAHQLLEWGQMVGLMIIAAATLIAIGHLLHEMVLVMRVTLADLLLLFIYLEVLAMVSMYLKAGKLPIRIPIYIAIVALARYLILDMKEMDTWRLLGVGGTALLLTLTVFLIRYGHYRFPYQQDE
ncbi:MAG: phosphate-starvation-inducible PsiE family protein [Aeromonadaceae bacterium]|jgi:protein PsiE|nr:phosphate-starvation-inducible PsiE family protein [Aeromonadaceae bacterium]